MDEQQGPEEVTEEAARRRHREIYRRPGLSAFEFSRVTDRLLAGRNPLSACDVDDLVREGVTHVLDLREEHEWNPPQHGADALLAMERHGLTRRHLPVPDTTAPTRADLETAYAFLAEALSGEKGCVYVHCRGGRERSAAVLVGFHARQQGLSYEEALRALQAGRPIFEPLWGQERAAREWLRAADG